MMNKAEQLQRILLRLLAFQDLLIETLCLGKLSMLVQQEGTRQFFLDTIRTWSLLRRSECGQAIQGSAS